MTRRPEVGEMESLAEGLHRLSTAVLALVGVCAGYAVLCVVDEWLSVLFYLLCLSAVGAVATQLSRWYLARQRYEKAKGLHDSKVKGGIENTATTPTSSSTPPAPASTSSRAPMDENKYILQATQLRERKLYSKSRSLAEEAVQKFPRSQSLLSLLCDVCNDEASSLRSTDPLQETALRCGAEAAAKLVARFQDSCDGHKWSAVFVARLTSYKPFTEKVSDVLTVRKHAANALERDPTDPLSNHMMGAWVYGISSLSWYQKKAAQTATGDSLDADVKDALRYLTTAHDRSEGGFMENSSLLGDCYKLMGNLDEADEWYTRALAQNKGPKDIPSQAAKIKKKMANPP